ncbi:MAG: hypothetical protein JXA54_04095 [Candidatus Heimdallarchaeota archaeon]|nr:hypothetical protein [Candidatus Heimdallarchaeota archaeon]
MNLEIKTIIPHQFLHNELTIDSLNLHALSSVERNLLEVKEDSLIKRNQLPYNRSNRVLIIIPGYSVSNPPKIGDHRYYIEALKYHPTKNPFGYKQIYLYDLYSKKDGRCNFDYNITKLADELFCTIDNKTNGWRFMRNSEIDFLAASMGGLILRKFLFKYLHGESQIKTASYGNLTIRNIVMIGTPNYGCIVIDKLRAPLVQFLFRLFFGKNNFSKSEQFQQLGIGNVKIYGGIFGKISQKKSPVNDFLDGLNNLNPTPGKIRWITIRGTKSQWFSKIFYSKKEENDGVVSASSVNLPGAENIADYQINKSQLWNHRDLYQDENVCKLLNGLLVMNYTLAEYLQTNQLLDNQTINSRRVSSLEKSISRVKSTII